MIMIYCGVSSIILNTLSPELTETVKAFTVLSFVNVPTAKVPTSGSIFHLEKLIVAQVVKSSAFYVVRSFITMFRKACN